MMPRLKAVAPMLLVAALSCGAGVSGAGAADSNGQVQLNWTIEQVHLGAQQYRIEMRKNRIAVGGEGEAMPLFMRRAEALVMRHGGGSYRIVSFAESLDSALPLPQRVAQGVVEILP
jgi:hypothetical protein